MKNVGNLDTQPCLSSYILIFLLSHFLGLEPPTDYQKQSNRKTVRETASEKRQDDLFILPLAFLVHGSLNFAAGGKVELAYHRILQTSAELNWSQHVELLPCRASSRLFTSHSSRAILLSTFIRRQALDFWWAGPTLQLTTVVK